MEQINNIISLLKTHWVEVLAVIGAVDVILGIITKFTPTKIDDNVYALVHKWILKLTVKK
jgi:hypothetical protein